MISGSLAVEGPPRGLGLSVPGHHLHHTSHHPTPPFVTYHPTAASTAVSHLQHHAGVENAAAAAAAAAAAHAWGNTMVTSQPPPPVSTVSMSHQSASQHKQSEFLMPLPKPLTNRYNGGAPSTATSSQPSSSLNGLRSSVPSRSSKYSPPAPVSSSDNNGPVNLAQHKEEPTSNMTTAQEEIYHQSQAAAAYARIYVPQAFSYGNPTLGHYRFCPPPYTPLLTRNALETSSYLSQQVYSPPRNLTSIPPSTGIIGPSSTSSSHSAAHSTGAAPAVQPSSPRIKSPTMSIKENINRKSSLSNATSSGPSISNNTSSGGGGGGAPNVTNEPFKVPSGKEGSLKHRILTRPSTSSVNSVTSDNNSVNKRHVTISAASGHPSATLVSTPSRTLNNNTIIPPGFGKDALICLGNGELKRVEDMRTEDFVQSAQQCPELCIADSTVVRIEEIPMLGTARITFSYNQNRTQVEHETLLEHPLFVYGQGWASCAPERTLQCFGLKCQRLQVGDICITLMPRENNLPKKTPPNTPGGTLSNKSGTITTTATTTAMTTRQISPKTSSSTTTTSIPSYHLNKNITGASQPPRTHSAEEVAAAIEASNARKRRWSAPDQIFEDEEPVTKQTHRRHKE